MDPIGQPRLGRLAVDLGFVHPDHLHKALVVQEALPECLAASIAVILVELRYMTRKEAHLVGIAAEALALTHEEALARPSPRS